MIELSLTELAREGKHLFGIVLQLGLGFGVLGVVLAAAAAIRSRLSSLGKLRDFLELAFVPVGGCGHTIAAFPAEFDRFVLCRRC